jgi:chorismate synthase
VNSAGRLFRVELFGESHGAAVGVLVDGCPPGLPLSPEALEPDLARRRAGAEGTTPRREADIPEIVSGVHEGRTTGTPIVMMFRNADTISPDYADYARMPRPGHADFTGGIRYRGFADPRGGGHFSGRVTAGLVAAGAIAKLLLPGARFETRIIEAGGSQDVAGAVKAALADGDSVGGVVEVRVAGLPAGLGEPFFGGVESAVSANVFAVPGIRGIEFGDGFATARMRGSEHNDPFVSPAGDTARNGAGGVNGGITNGNELVLRAAVKPTSTIGKTQSTYDFQAGAMGELAGKGRHDACIALRAAVAIEAAVAISLADLALISDCYDHSIGEKA